MSPENFIDGNAALALVEDELEPSDRHEQLRQLYLALLTRQERFDEFKQLLSAYPAAASIEDAEPEEAHAARVKLNERISEWIGGPFEGLSVSELLLWRVIVVEERFNVALSPWKESNSY
jgi:hypothetical protein